MPNQLKKYALLPITALYYCVLRIRHFLYDVGVFKSWKSPIKTICIGNLSFGGTGKTPFTQYLINKLKKDFSIAVVSRGYGRKTKGLNIVEMQSLANEVGDEPLQIKTKFDDVLVVVCEQRKRAIEWIVAEHPSINLILLDDALQHRAVKADVNLLLTTYQNPFFKDALVPSGNLRDIKARVQKTNAIIVTKCPANIEPSNLKKPTYYSSIQYQNWEVLNGNFTENKIEEILLVTGIAKPKYIVQYLQDKGKIVLSHEYADHHNFTLKDLERIDEAYQKIKNPKKCILTTQKDWMRLQAFKAEITKFGWQLAYLPIEIKVENEEALLEQILQKITQ